MTISHILDKRMACKSILLPTNLSHGYNPAISTCIKKRKKGDFIFVLVFISVSVSRKQYEGQKANKS